MQIVNTLLFRENITADSFVFFREILEILRFSTVENMFSFFGNDLLLKRSYLKLARMEFRKDQTLVWLLPK